MRRNDIKTGNIRIYVKDPRKGVLIKDEECLARIKLLQKEIKKLQEENKRLRIENLKLKRQIDRIKRKIVLVPKSVLLKAGQKNIVNSLVSRDIVGSLMEIFLSTS